MVKEAEDLRKKRREYYAKNKLEIYKQRLKYKRTKRGLIYTTFTKMHEMSRDRGHSMPSFTRDELYNFIMGDIKFHSLFDKWKESKYEKPLKPSVDRINDFIGYSLDNIRIVTWRENNLSGARGEKLKICTRIANSKKIRKVIFTVNGITRIAESSKVAAEIIGVCRPYVTMVANGTLKSKLFQARYILQQNQL